jgi:D-alanyl-lipoteichoic acid acyltransferase DltB (MBOAT superfamily)
MLGVIAFAFQIYGDFAGYSLIAIGLARIMGYDFGINFNKPYFALNFSDFWQRWHMSLSSWIRDYLYIPLGGSQQGSVRTIINLIITMFLAGLWHGAGWNFVVWGLLHGLYLAGQRMLSKPYESVCRAVRCPEFVSKSVCMLTVFTLTCVAWVFFREKSIGNAFYMLKAMVSWQATAHLSFGGMKYQLLRVAILVGIVLLVDWLSTREPIRIRYQSHGYGRAVFAGLAVLVILFTASFAANSFIYFQF